MRKVRKFVYGLTLAACIGVLPVAAPFAAPAKGMGNAPAKAPAQDAGSVAASSLPMVKLSHWKDSAVQERRAFLMGLLSMLEVERFWQGAEGLPLSQSMVGSWSRAFAGVTIPEMDTALTEYLQAHPGDMDMSVLEVLGTIYIVPKLSKAEQDEAAARYKKLTAGAGK